MAASIHDNKLISYTVNEQTRQITLETIFDDKTPSEHTDVVFTGVAAYYFEDHSLSMGTILNGIDEVDPNLLVESNWAMFEERKIYSWPGPWAESKVKASDFFKVNNIRGFEITSACGLSGWVMSQQMTISPKA